MCNLEPRVLFQNEFDGVNAHLSIRGPLTSHERDQSRAFLVLDYVFPRHALRRILRLIKSYELLDSVCDPASTVPDSCVNVSHKHGLRGSELFFIHLCVVEVFLSLLVLYRKY